MSVSAHRYFIVNKPYNMVSQFISPDAVRLLGSIDFDFPEGIHAIGRLDSNSEGLLILTTNRRVTKLLFESKTPHARVYLVKVRGAVSEESVQKLRSGISICIKGPEDWVTTPCEAQIVEKPENLFSHPYENKEYGPHSWLRITLQEGKFHQVRKMTEAISHRCVRLIRVSIEDMELGDLQPGEVREFEEADFFRQLKIHDWVR
jgi:23S rRNA pseudouridine2457 synthase